MHEIRTALANWMLIQVLHALETQGVLKLLSTDGGAVTVAELVSRTKVREGELVALLDFLCLVEPFILKKVAKDSYQFQIDFDYDLLLNLTYFSHAYAPVAYQLGGLLSGELTYGKEVARNSASLNRSSEIYTRQIAQDLGRLIQSDHPTMVVDLGCGSGHVLKTVCDHCACEGIGIDQIAAIGEVQSSDTVRFLEGDIAAPDSWASEVPVGTVFIASMVLHEFLRNGTTELAVVLDRLRTYFKGSVMYVVEYNGYTFEKLAELAPADRGVTATYQLLHPLTQQGMPVDKERWLQVFEECGVKLHTSIAAWPNATIYKIEL